MQIKRLIYVSLAAMMLSGSLINVPDHAWAAESESATSVSETEKETSTESIDVNTKKPTTSEQAPTSRSAEPVGTPSNADKPSKDGWSFLLTIFRRGFSRQPQEEDYFALQDIDKAKFSGMSILTNLGNGLGKDITVRRWHWDASQNNWVEDKRQPKAKTGWSLIMGSLGFLDVNDYALNKSGNLGVGTYYYQFSFSDGIWPFNKTFYSDLAKVGITPEPKPAKSINADTDNADGTSKVIYSDVNYGAKAIVDPVDSTDDITWQAASAEDLLKFTPNNGRKTSLVAGNGEVGSDKQYIPDSYYVNQVNRDPKVPGIPANFKVAAGNVAANKGVYVGGLPAYNRPMDTGGSWTVGGLSDLVKATGSTSAWHYAWRFMDSTGKTIELPAASGVTNSSGDIDELANLNTAQPLTFAKDSLFMKQAAAATASGKSYQAQLTLTTSVDSEEESSKKTEKVVVVSNKAELQVQPSLGKLTLDQVPNFRFGNVLAKDVYAGTNAQNQPYEVNDTLKITDTRVNSGWKLTAKMSKMASTTGKQLSSTAINMTGLPTNVGLSDNDTETPIMADKVSKTWQVAGKLALSANPNIQLAAGDTFSSNITWTLNSAQPAAPAA
ncbi:WxL domain-containing protein [Latilactobacillus curvatus]|uniref:WxL domain-containing protein n=1 Tax=Latilactobacillus curvatus TaxID=28038 RepID=UPI0024113BEB|nr:WxL domain-containing protein [Latilactobacillus curvatus]MDG2979803.1 WxL domain-containing protein [Latilactobacillus curvatus]